MSQALDVDLTEIFRRAPDLGFAELEGARQPAVQIGAERGEGEGLTSERTLDQRATGIHPDPSHLVREDAERHSRLGRGGCHRVVAGDDKESFGPLCGVLPDEDPAQQRSVTGAWVDPDRGRSACAAAGSARDPSGLEVAVDRGHRHANFGGDLRDGLTLVDVAAPQPLTWMSSRRPMRVSTPGRPRARG
ncbi:hypothetical protein [Microbacterium aurum]